jgi:hypothetical protein
MLFYYLAQRLASLKNIGPGQIFSEHFSLFGVPGIYIPNNLPTPFRIKNPLVGAGNY